MLNLLWTIHWDILLCMCLLFAFLLEARALLNAETWNLLSTEQILFAVFSVKVKFSVLWSCAWLQCLAALFIVKLTKLKFKMGESPCITYMALYILTFHILQTNSRTSTFWKLNVEDGKITEVNHFPSIVTSTLPNDNGDDPIFNIITSTVHFGKSWTKRSAENYCTDCQSANVSHR